MKVFALATAALIIQTIPSMAPAAETPDPHAGHHMTTEAKVRPAVYKTSGVVKKIDPAGGSVTLTHGAVPELKWPTMTMAFKVKEQAFFDKLAIGRTIEFEFVEQGKSYVITAVK